MMTDPIADMLTRMRNAIRVKKSYVDIPASKMKAQIARILLERGYVKNVKYIEEEVQGKLRVYLKYGENNESAIEGLKRISLPSRRVYVDKKSIPRVMGGYGTAIISTSRGIMTDKECRELGLGGEVICHVW
ncbi:MAG: 30S ribosomal protein S8 [Candidatus Latescibacteria bacterium 4484_7]|nr:MAG: 30S ribosomal protein S8 [Candidatus Latescibacteria bacterium 4484_7]RKZ09131.1 MAG: 30S ribosomal protein S8 [bacterium]